MRILRLGFSSFSNLKRSRHKMSRNKAKVTPTFTIDPKGYTGSLYLDNNPKNLNTNGGKPFQSPPLPPQTSPNMHTLDNGSRILGSYITFNVDNNGNVGNISNPLSATAKANTLTLQTVPVGIDSGCPHYTGLIAFGTYYLLNYPTPGGPLPYLTTPTPPNKPLIHIACLKYGVDTGGLIGALSYPTLPASYFYYQVRDDGKVWSESSAGSGGSKRFFLNSGEIAIISCFLWLGSWIHLWECPLQEYSSQIIWNIYKRNKSQ
jgi:hypothetical protein